MALWYLRGQLPAIRQVVQEVRPRWSLVALASAVALLTYALLIETWRRVLMNMGARLSFARAALIWLGSSLARYLPLSGWQFAVMSAMARRRNVPLAVSAGASVLVTIVNVATGLVVLAVTSATTPQLRGAGVLLLGVGLLALLIAPFAIPRLARMASRLTGRAIVMPTFGLRPLLTAAVGTTLAWLAYGVAFAMLSRSIFPLTTPPLAACIAVYVFAYLAGLLAFVPPAGVGAAEVAMVFFATQLGVYGKEEAIVLSLVVRAWRTVMETVPAMIALAMAAVVDGDGPTTSAPAA